MVFELNLLSAGVAVFIVVGIAKYSKLKGRGWDWLVGGGVFLLFAGILSATTLQNFLGPQIWGGLSSIFEIIGIVSTGVGTVLIGYEVLTE